MKKNILTLFLGLITLVSCTHNKHTEIKTLCLRDDIGNYVIKWEINPSFEEGIVKMYVSDDPNQFGYSDPVGYIDINDGVTTYITNDNVTRKYFKLIFNNQFVRVLGPRNINMDRINNFRDIGGYQPNSFDKEQTQWGKVFRSGSLININCIDSLRLANLKLRTIIDLRTNQEKTLYPIEYDETNVVNLPIKNPFYKDIIKNIRAGKMLKGDINIMLQNHYLCFIDNNQNELGAALRVFLNPKNYPILMMDSFGKDRVGVLSALLLYALGIPTETITHDYILSNEYIKKQDFAYLVRGASTEKQEALTTFLSVKEQYINLTFRYIKRKYGSIDRYLVNQLEFTPDLQAKLKDILLK